MLSAASLLSSTSRIRRVGALTADQGLSCAAGSPAGSLPQERQTDDELGSVAEARARGLHTATV